MDNRRPCICHYASHEKSDDDRKAGFRIDLVRLDLIVWIYSAAMCMDEPKEKVCK